MSLGNKLIQFSLHNWLLVSAFFVVLVALLMEEFAPNASGGLDVAGALMMINRDNPAVIDLRDQAAYEKGHIIDAYHMPVDQVARKIKRLDRKQPILLVCADGRAAARLAARCEEVRAHAEVTVLQGGMKAWHDAHMPVTLGKKRGKHDKN